MNPKPFLTFTTPMMDVCCIAITLFIPSLELFSTRKLLNDDNSKQTVDFDYFM